MTAEHTHHEELIAGIRNQLKSVLESSEQAIYVYLDDEHKFCNNKFAELLGYASADAWAKSEGPFAEKLVAEESQGRLIGAYQDAMEKKVGSTCQIVWKKTSGDTVSSTVILVPIAFDEHTFALHFVTA